MERTTKAHAQSAFVHLAGVLGKRIATDYKDVGAWRLDYNPTYGGGVIEEIITPTGAVRHPLGSQRRNAREFYDAAWFAVRCIEEQGKRAD